MAKGRKPVYETRIVTPEYHEAPKPRSWQKEGEVIKTMYHAYGLPGRIGDIVEVPMDMYDELVEKKFIKPV